MRKQSKKMTASEREVLELLWQQGKPLTSSEIVALSEDKSWKPSYIHLMINSLLKKEIIQIAGFKKTTKNFARSFEPVLSKEEFSIQSFREENHLDTSSLSLLFGALLEEETDRETIDKLSAMLEQKKRELDEE